MKSTRSKTDQPADELSRRLAQAMSNTPGGQDAAPELLRAADARFSRIGRSTLYRWRQKGSKSDKHVAELMRAAIEILDAGQIKSEIRIRIPTSDCAVAAMIAVASLKKEIRPKADGNHPIRVSVFPTGADCFKDVVKGKNLKGYVVASRESLENVSEEDLDVRLKHYRPLASISRKVTAGLILTEYKSQSDLLAAKTLPRIGFPDKSKYKDDVEGFLPQFAKTFTKAADIAQARLMAGSIGTPCHTAREAAKLLVQNQVIGVVGGSKWLNDVCELLRATPEGKTVLKQLDERNWFGEMTYALFAHDQLDSGCHIQLLRALQNANARMLAFQLNPAHHQVEICASLRDLAVDGGFQESISSTKTPKVGRPKQVERLTGSTEGALHNEIKDIAFTLNLEPLTIFDFWQKSLIPK